MRKRRAGFMSSVLLLVLSITLMGILSVFTAAMNQIAQTRRSQGRISGEAVAEAGLEIAIQKLNLNTKFTGETAVLYEDDTNPASRYGQYTTSLTQLSPSTWRVTSVGMGPENIARTMMAIVEMPVKVLGVEAILTNDALTLTGLVNLQSLPSGLHKANVVSNTSITKLGLSLIDGALISSGLISGTGLLPSISGTAKVPFPDATGMAKMKARWISQAKMGGTLSAASTLPATIQGSRYIDGTVTLSGNSTLTLNSDGTDVVYIDGDLILSGNARLTNNVTLVVRGRVQMLNNARYSITPTVTPTPTLVVLGEGYFPADITANLIGGSSSTDWGVVWLNNGSLDLRANVAVRGSWVVSGVGSNIRFPLLAFTQYVPANYSSSVSLSLGARTKKIAEM